MLKSTLEKVFWALAIATFPLFFAVLIWISLPTSAFFRVQGYSYDPETDTVTMTRNVLGDSDVVVKELLTVTGADGRSCYYRSEHTYSPFTGTGSPITQEIFTAPEALRPCLDRKPYTMVGRYHTYLIFLPLKPTWYFEPPRE